MENLDEKNEYRWEHFKNSLSLDMDNSLDIEADSSQFLINVLHIQLTMELNRQLYMELAVHATIRQIL